MSELNIYQRINAVMKEIHYIKKDTKVDNKYMAISHDMVLASLRPQLVEFGIVVRVNQLEGKYVQLRDLNAGIKQHLYQGFYQIDFVNMDKPEEFCATRHEGHACDAQGMSAGKAESYAVKYAMIKMFGIETGENEESRVPEEEDCSQAVIAIANAPDMDQLQTIFKLQWAAFPKSRPQLTAAKDGRKKALMQ
jgi:hypothetical protein